MLAELLAAAGPLALPLVAVLIVAETGLVVGVALPGGSALLGLGALARAHVVPLTPALVAAAVAAVLGAQLGYRAGRRTQGHPSHEAILRRVGMRRYEQVQRMLQRYGWLAVIGGQWVVAVRTLTPRIVGATGLSRRVFTACSTPSAAAWACAMTLAGYAAAAQVQS